MLLLRTADVCPDCMTTSPVGMRCPECARQRTKVVRMRDMTRTPQVTVALIAINAIIFLAEGGGSFSVSGGGGGTLSTKFALLGSGLTRGPGGQGIEYLGVAYGQWWRIVTGGSCTRTSCTSPSTCICCMCWARCSSRCWGM